MTKWYDNVPAPTDRNGHEVPLDTRELVFDGKTRGVLRIAYSVDLGRWVADLSETSEHPLISACTLPDSWERLEEDARKTPREYIEGRCIPVGNDGRVAAMARDLVRRAKALAGVAD